MDAALGQQLISSGSVLTNGFGFGLFVPHQRSIADIIAEVTVEEDERDEVQVTAHPVEQGAPINDHAFKAPEEVTVRVGWSIQKSGDISADSGVYKSLLDLQASFLPFDLVTGKRVHKNMLITNIMVTTDQTSEYVLIAMLSCREIILTSTQTSTTGLSSNSSDHADPASTGPQVNQGDQSLSGVTSPSVTSLASQSIENTPGT